MRGNIYCLCLTNVLPTDDRHSIYRKQAGHSKAFIPFTGQKRHNRQSLRNVVLFLQKQFLSSIILSLYRIYFYNFRTIKSTTQRLFFSLRRSSFFIFFFLSYYYNERCVLLFNKLQAQSCNIVITLFKIHSTFIESHYDFYMTLL